MMLIIALWPLSIPVSYIFREPSRTRTLLGTQVPVCETEQQEARAEQHRLGELRSRISRTSYCSTRKEPDSRPSLRTGRDACAALCATLSLEIGY